MQVHGPSQTVKDGSGVTVRLNGEFAVVEVGHVSLFLYTPEEADWLIKAAVEAKRLLSPPGDGGVLFPAGDDDEADEDGPCMKVGCGHSYDDHSLDLEQGDRLYCQRCECRRFLSARAMRVSA